MFENEIYFILTVATCGVRNDKGEKEEWEKGIGDVRVLDQLTSTAIPRCM